MGKRRTRKTGLVARYGPRYGATLRKKALGIEKRYKATYTCQQCGRPTVRKRNIGVWQCSKCGYTFAGAAYSPSISVRGG
ncbi:MAG: 50S ribosomal protein L37ae [Aigarchaeota archaeon]|nr:50S ribosomal protein L37ae [Aigarchaeota archaeon]